MVTGDEGRALQLEAAKDEAKFWEAMQETNEELSLGQHGLATLAERKRTETKQAAENAAKHVAAAKDRISRLERGEDIGGTTKIDVRKLFRDVGVTDSDIRHYGVVSRIPRVRRRARISRCDPAERTTRKANGAEDPAGGRAAKAGSPMTDRLTLTRVRERRHAERGGRALTVLFGALHYWPPHG